MLGNGGLDVLGRKQRKSMLEKLHVHNEDWTAWLHKELTFNEFGLFILLFMHLFVQYIQFI